MCNSFLVDRLEGCHVEVDREGDNGPPVLRVLLVCEGLEQGGNVLIQLLHVGLARQLVYGDIGLGAHIDTGATFTVKVIKTLETFLATGAVGVELALARLE